MKIKGAIFDLDGTILDSCHVWKKVDADFLGKRGRNVPPDYAEAIIKMTFREAAEYTIERFELNENPEDVMAEWNQMALYQYSYEVPLRKGTKEVLAWFAEKKIPVGVATSNTSMLFEPCLKRNGVYEMFHSFTEVGEVSRGKEFPDIYIKEAEKLGCDPENCLVFEDIIPALKSAESGGFVTIGVVEPTWKYTEEELISCCYYKIDEIYDALVLLNSLK